MVCWHSQFPEAEAKLILVPHRNNRAVRELFSKRTTYREAGLNDDLDFPFVQSLLVGARGAVPIVQGTERIARDVVHRVAAGVVMGGALGCRDIFLLAF